MLIEALEQLYDQLSPEVRATWFKIWTELATAPGLWVRPAALLDAIESLGLGDDAWRAIAKNLVDQRAEVYVGFGPD